MNQAGRPPLLRCFVIMPFVERDPMHPPGFFDEVFEHLLLPAVSRAGFEAMTARRAGTDLIQSTIVNDLLDADLVLCDLTEHNPNVLFELGLRLGNDLPVALVKALGTPPLFDIDHMLRVAEYSPNLWRSTLDEDGRKIEGHLRAAWDSRATGRSFMRVLRDRPS